MKGFAVAFAALILAGCAGMMETSGAGAMDESRLPYSHRVFDANDPYHGG